MPKTVEHEGEKVAESAKQIERSTEKVEQSTERVETSADRRTELAGDRTVLARPGQELAVGAERHPRQIPHVGDVVSGFARGEGCQFLPGGDFPQDQAVTRK